MVSFFSYKLKNGAKIKYNNLKNGAKYIKTDCKNGANGRMIDYLNAEMSAEDFLVKLKMIMPEEYKPHETVVFLMKYKNARRL